MVMMVVGLLYVLALRGSVIPFLHLTAEAVSLFYYFSQKYVCCIKFNVLMLLPFFRLLLLYDGIFRIIYVFAEHHGLATLKLKSSNRMNGTVRCTAQNVAASCK